MHPERDWVCSRHNRVQCSGKGQAVNAAASVGQLLFVTITQPYNFSTKASTDKEEAWLFSNKMLFTDTDNGLDSVCGLGVTNC